MPSNKWSHLLRLLEHDGPFALHGNDVNFRPDEDLLTTIHEYVRILVVGAGGLGCELLKDLALSGIRNIDVVDMDTIDISNLNRQFLFRATDVGSFKAEVAARYINNRISGTNVVAHNCMIQEKSLSFYQGFHVIVLGLDSIVARRWMNNTLFSMVQYDEKGDITYCIPMVDGGSEGFKGNVRIIWPGRTPCLECTIDLYPPQVVYPMCTLAHTPRLPEHCIEFIRVLQWPQENPFGDSSVNGDDPKHIQWIYERALSRASTYSITGVTYRLTQGVVKHIIPAVASTNAVISAQCATEVLKLCTGISTHIDNYMLFNDAAGVYSFTFPLEKNESCVTCNRVPQVVTVSADVTLRKFIDILTADPLQLKSPHSLTTTLRDGSNKTLYMKLLHEQTKQNLSKSLQELGLYTDCQVDVGDITRPNPLCIKLSFNV